MCSSDLGCTIVGPTWIGHGSHIRAGATLVRSIVFEHTRVDRDASLFECIVSGRYGVDRHGKEARGENRTMPAAAKRRPVWADARLRQSLAA